MVKCNGVKAMRQTLLTNELSAWEWDWKTPVLWEEGRLTVGSVSEQSGKNIFINGRRM